MEPWLKGAWFLIAAVHITPAAVFFVPNMTQKLYGVASTGNIGVLLTHRGALFLAMAVTAILAAIDPGSRRSASIILSISILGFLYVYVFAGSPSGPLRDIAIADCLATIPLAFVSFYAWRTI